MLSEKKNNHPARMLMKYFTVLLVMITLGIGVFTGAAQSETNECTSSETDIPSSDALRHIFDGVYHSLSRNYVDAVEAYTRAMESGGSSGLIYYLRGNAHLLISEWKDAEEDFTCAIALSPEAVEPYLSRGGIYQALQSYVQAREDFNRAIELAPSDWRGYFGRAAAYFSENEDWKGALDDVNRAIELDPTQDTTHYARGLYYSYIGEYENALEDFSQAIELTNASIAYYFVVRASMYSELRDIQNAITDMGIAIELEPENDEYYFYRAQLYRYAQEFILAIEDLNTVLELNWNVDALFLRGDSYFWLGEYESAVADYSIVIESESDNTSAYLARAINFMHLYESESARDDIETILNREPETSWEYLFQANLYRGLRRYQQAIAFIEKAIALDPENTQAYSLRSWIYYLLGETELAKADSQQVLVFSNPSAAAEYATQASAYFMDEAYDLALIAIESALGEEPENAGYLYMRAQIYQALGREAEAIQDYETSLALNKNNYQAVRNLGDMTFDRHAYEAALDYYESARKIAFTDFEIYARLGETYEALDRTDEALLAYEMYVTLLGEYAEPEIVKQAEAVGVILVQ